MPWLNKSNIFVDTYASSAGAKVSAIDAKTPSPGHTISVRNGATLPYDIRVEGKSSGAALNFSGKLSWQSSAIPLFTRATIRPTEGVTRIAAGQESLACVSVEVDNHVQKTKSTHSNLSIVCLVQVR